MIVMGDHDPGRIARGFDEFRRHRIAGGPQLHRLIIDRISNTENFRAGVGRVPVSADVFQNCAAARLIVPMQNMLLRKFAAALRRAKAHASASSRSAMAWRRE